MQTAMGRSHRSARRWRGRRGRRRRPGSHWPGAPAGTGPV